MKKLLVLFLAVIFVISLSAFSCDSAEDDSGGNLQSSFFQLLFGGSNSDGAEDKGSAVTENTTQKNSGKKTAETLIDWMIGGTYYMKYTVDAEAGGQTMTMKGVMAAQGDNVAVTSETTAAGQVVKSRMIAVDGTTYIIEDFTKIIMKSPVNISEASKETVDYSKMKKTGSGTGKVKGKTLPYEEYQSEGYTIKFYIDGNKVYAIETEGNGGKSLLIIEEESKTVPRGSFDLPKGYTMLSF